MSHLEGALDGLIFAQVQSLNELLDLGLAPGVLSLPLSQLLPLLREVDILVQGPLIHTPAWHPGGHAYHVGA